MLANEDDEQERKFLPNGGQLSHFSPINRGGGVFLLRLANDTKLSYLVYSRPLEIVRD